MTRSHAADACLRNVCEPDLTKQRMKTSPHVMDAHLILHCKGRARLWEGSTPRLDTIQCRMLSLWHPQRNTLLVG